MGNTVRYTRCLAVFTFLFKKSRAYLSKKALITKKKAKVAVWKVWSPLSILLFIYLFYQDAKWRSVKIGRFHGKKRGGGILKWMFKWTLVLNFSHNSAEIDVQFWSHHQKSNLSVNAFPWRNKMAVRRKIGLFHGKRWRGLLK